MGYKICPYCGASLDSDEKCDCRKKEENETRSDQEVVYQKPGTDSETDQRG